MTYLIACGRSKAEGPARARDLYVGKPTQRVLAEAESQGRTFILSALHGLVDPDEVIEPYDLALDDLTTPEKIAWATKVRAQLAARGIDPRSLVYVGSAPTYERAVAYLRGER